MRIARARFVFFFTAPLSPLLRPPPLASPPPTFTQISDLQNHIADWKDTELRLKLKLAALKNDTAYEFYRLKAAKPSLKKKKYTNGTVIDPVVAGVEQSGPALAPGEPVPPALDEAVDAPADGKTAGGAAPAVTNTRQQMLGPGPPGPIPYNNLIIHNNFTERVYVVTAGVQFTRPGYFPGVPATTSADRWAVTGWFWVEPQQKTLVFTTRANKAWFYAQTNGGTHVWGGNNATDVAVYPDDVPFSTASGGYVSSFTTPNPVIHQCVFF